LQIAIVDILTFDTTGGQRQSNTMMRRKEFKLMVCLVSVVIGSSLLYLVPVESESSWVGVLMLVGFCFLVFGIVLGLQGVVRLTQIPETVLREKWRQRRARGKAAYVGNYILGAMAADLLLWSSFFAFGTIAAPSTEEIRNYVVMSLAVIVLSVFIAFYLWRNNERRFNDGDR